MTEQQDTRSPSAMISTSAVQLLHEYTGRGPTKAKTMINEDLVTIVLADTLTKGEQKLVENGRDDRVVQLRHDYQMVMRRELISLVESQLERKVIAFMSQNHIDPDLAVEVFVLQPEGGDATERVGFSLRQSASCTRRGPGGSQSPEGQTGTDVKERGGFRAASLRLAIFLDVPLPARVRSSAASHPGWLTLQPTTFLMAAFGAS